MQQFEFDVEYRNSDENADFLSRFPVENAEWNTDPIGISNLEQFNTVDPVPITIRDVTELKQLFMQIRYATN